MQIIETVDALMVWRASGAGSVGLVPTMGALHAGHASLIKRSVTDNDLTLVSVFVNRTQFQQQDDLEQYPQTLEADLKLLRDLQVDALFMPPYPELYPDDYSIKVTESKLTQMLDGASRPGYFDGILTVVLKLLMVAGADRAYFGEKDFQQILAVEKLVSSFFVPTQIVRCPTVREPSGLAMASRNLRLTPERRTHAAKLYQTLVSEPDRNRAWRSLEALGFEMDYLEDHFGRRFVAALLDGIRLIDNVPLAELEGLPTATAKAPPPTLTQS